MQISDWLLVQIHKKINTEIKNEYLEISIAICPLNLIIIKTWVRMLFFHFLFLVIKILNLYFIKFWLIADWKFKKTKTKCFFTTESFKC